MPKRDRSSDPLPERPCDNSALHSGHVYANARGRFKCPGGQKAIPVIVPTCGKSKKHRGHRYWVKRGARYVRATCPGKK